MPIPSIYINLEDDVAKIVTRVKKEKSKELVLVCPKRCFLFNDSINLRLLKKQVDLLGKTASILTMDEKGQLFAKEAGFALKTLPKMGSKSSVSDIGRKEPAPSAIKPKDQPGDKIISTVSSLKNIFTPAAEIKSGAAATKKTASKITAHKKTSPFAAPAAEHQSLFPSELEKIYHGKQSKSKIAKVAAGFLFLALLTFGAIMFAVLPNAIVTVYPKTQNLVRDLPEVTTFAMAADTDVAKLILPAKKIEQPASAQHKFQSQGKKEVGNKASGSIVIYNFTGSPINLRAKTTLAVLNGKNYALKSDVLQLKPTKYKNAKTREVDESSLASPVEVEAAEGGEGYNLPAGTRLEITNQVFGSQPQVLYAKVSSAITGGTSRYLSVVSQNDINAAKDYLQKQVTEGLFKDLSAQGLELNDKAFNLVDPKFVFDREVGSETPEFSGSLKAQVVALAYDQKQMNELILSRIRQSLNSDSKVSVKLSSPLKLNLKTADLNNGIAVYEVHFEGKAVALSDYADRISGQIKGKSRQDAANYIKNQGDVEKVEILITPGWQSWLPFFKNKIQVRILEE